MLIPIPVVLFGIGFLIALVSVPLILRKIPMNHFYGIRLRKAFVSQRNWYDLNAYGGRLFFIFGLGLMAFAVLARDLAPPPTSPWAPVFLVLPLLAILPIRVLIGGSGRHLPDQ